LFIGFALRLQVGIEMETMGRKAKENMKIVVSRVHSFTFMGNSRDKE
jgi:hypothetical protein